MEALTRADGLAPRAALGPARTRVDVGRDEEPSATGASAEVGLGWRRQVAFAELDAAIDRSAVVHGDADQVVDAVSVLGLGAAAGYRGAYGIEAAATARWARVSLRYDDPDWDYERAGWAVGVRGAKTWRISGGWALGVELGAEVMFVDEREQDHERPLVWTYRARAVVLRE